LDVLETIKGHGLHDEKEWHKAMQSVFGDLEKVDGSQHDLFALAREVAKGSVKPRLYQCCGTEDFLYADNIRFRDHVRELPLDFTYEEGPGEHVWAYWDKMIQNVLKWMFS
jgi:S-formylglutathione hydrolase FrmB